MGAGRGGDGSAGRVPGHCWASAALKDIAQDSATEPPSRLPSCFPSSVPPSLLGLGFHSCPLVLGQVTLGWTVGGHPPAAHPVGPCVAGLRGLLGQVPNGEEEAPRLQVPPTAQGTWTSSLDSRRRAAVAWRCLSAQRAALPLKAPPSRGGREESGHRTGLAKAVPCSRTMEGQAAVLSLWGRGPPGLPVAVAGGAAAFPRPAPLPSVTLGPEGGLGLPGGSFRPPHQEGEAWRAPG